MRVRHCVVMGAGMIGLSVALRLVQRGVRVTVIDMNAPGSGTSGTTGAMVGANEKRPLAYFELGRQSMLAMDRLARELDVAGAYLPTGHLEWANTGATQLALDERVARLVDWDYDVQRLSPATVKRELEPDLVIPSDVAEVTFFSADSIVYPHTLMAFMLRKLRELGGEVRFGGGAASIRREGTSVTGVALGTGESIDADVVVVAAGRWTSDVLSEHGFALPLLHPWGPTPEALGLQVITNGVVADVRRMIRMPGLSIRPAGGGRLMLHGRPEEKELHALGAANSGITWDEPLDPIPDGAHALVEKLRCVMENTQSVKVQSATASIRPIPGDGLPVVGWVPGVSKLYTAVTHSGIGLAPLLGELIANEIADSESESLLASFRAERFSDPGWAARAQPMREAVATEGPIN